MNRDGVPAAQLRRVEPFNGLMIDAGTWRDAHDYHRRHQHLHSLLLHGWGIVRGLEVEPRSPPDRSLVIHPGAAIDPEGRLIVVSQPARYQVHTEDAKPIYLLLTFRDIPSESVLSPEDGMRRPSRMQEGYAVAEFDHLPDEPYIELARIRLRGSKDALTAAINPAIPGLNQIDARFRVMQPLRPGIRGYLGYWRADGTKPDQPATLADHADGAGLLVRALTEARWQGQWYDAPARAAEPLDCDLLILPVDKAFTLEDDDQRRLTAFLDEGGVILAEPCAGQLDSADLDALLGKFAKNFKRKGHPVEQGHPLLTAHHVFGTPPPGAVAGTLFEADGLLLSRADYACAWKGGLAGQPLSRETIRAAQEFGENLLAYALQRRRTRKSAR